MSLLAANEILVQAKAFHRSGRFADAIPLYEQLLRIRSDAPAVLSMLGSAQNSLGRVEEGRRNIEKAIALSPKTAHFHHDLALSYKRTGDFAKSHECLDTAIGLEPGQTTFRAAKAELQLMEGAFDAALATIEPALGVQPLAAPVAIIFGRLAPRFGREREATEHLESVLPRIDLAPAARMRSLFVLGSLHDRLGDYDKAFDCFAKANALYGGRFDAALHEQRVDATIAAFTPSAIAALPRAAVDASRMVFVVGMPRSGTTLVEQILSTSPMVHAAGELNTLPRIARTLEGGPRVGMPILTHAGNLTQQSLDNAGREYVAGFAAVDAAKRSIVDKTTLNVLNLALIQLALPGAKVIHCVRDPADVCFSNYAHLFDGAIDFAYDLVNTGRFHRDYVRLIEHWRRTLTLPILDVSYEGLVADVEGTSRRIFEFVGLPWTDKALSFHESDRVALTNSNLQVREPIYDRSIGRHRHYAAHLAPLYAALEGRDRT